jgi:hypothetical protein
VWTERGGSASPSPPSVLWAKANRLCPVAPFFFLAFHTFLLRLSGLIFSSVQYVSRLFLQDVMASSLTNIVLVALHIGIVTLILLYVLGCIITPFDESRFHVLPTSHGIHHLKCTASTSQQIEIRTERS